MTDLPKGWEWSTVGDVAHLINGDRGKHYPSKSDLVAEGMPFANAGHLNAGAIDFSTMNYITPERFHLLGGTAFVAGDILYCLRGSLGKMAVVRGSQTGKVASSLVVVRPSHMVSSDFMYHWLASPGGEAEIARYDNGSAQPNLAAKSLASFRLPTPPEPEQQRVVAAVDEAFSKLDAGEAGLRTVRQLLKRMRAAVLASAVTGRLVPQDPTDTPAPKLLADLGVEALDSPVLGLLPESWAWTSMGDVTVIGGGIQKQPKRVPAHNPTPFLRVANVGRGTLDLGDVHLIEVFDGELDRYGLERGDLLVVEGNGSPDQIGRSAMWHGDIDPCVHQNHLIRVRPLEVLLPEFLELYWNSPAASRRVQAVASSTSGLHTLSTGKLKRLPIAIPPPEEQARIVSGVGRQVSFLDACERAVDAGSELSAALRRSILKAAFEGELVSQDPSDEPASVLLERIRAERAAAPKPVRRSRRTA